MHGFSINSTAQSHYVNNGEEIQPQKNQETTTEKPLPIVEETKSIDTDNDKNKISAQELTIENFKEVIAKEYGCSYNKIKDNNSLAKRFSMILSNMSDEEKAEKLGFVLNEFQTNPCLIKVFFESFKDKEKAKECADSIDFNTFQELNPAAQKEIVKHMSVPGTQRLFNDYEENVYKFYHEHQELINKVYKNNLSDEERQSIIENLSDSDKLTINKYNELVNIGVNISAGVTCNKNFSIEDTENFMKQANDFFKELPNYNLFLEGMTKILSEDSNDLNIDKNKLTEILDKITDNKFSETVQKISEKSAIDESGKFKTAPLEVISESEEKIKEIKQTFPDTSTPETLTAVINDEIIESDDTIINYETLTQNGNITILKDVFAGKIKISEFLEQTAIKQYKLMDTAIQGNILLDASGKFFNDLIKNTKSSALENLLAAGWKGKCYDATQKVKNEVQERNDDVA